jgi:hypothetical protein
MVVEKKKYIIELPKNTHWIQWIMESTKDHHPYMDYKQTEDLTPYTEPDTGAIREEAFRSGYDAACRIIDIKSKTNAAYQKGLSDAWECARKIADIPYGEEEKVFGSDGWTFIANHTAQEAIEEIRQYEQEKDRQARIEYNFDEVKDVVETTAKEYNMSFDEIAEVLKKMGEH